MFGHIDSMYAWPAGCNLINMDHSITIYLASFASVSMFIDPCRVFTGSMSQQSHDCRRFLQLWIINVPISFFLASIATIVGKPLNELETKPSLGPQSAGMRLTLIITSFK